MKRTIFQGLIKMGFIYDDAKLFPFKDDLISCRWRFDWVDGKKSIISQWMREGDDPKKHAWCTNKSGLLYAAIEIKGNVNRVVRRKVEVNGQDFRDFKWIYSRAVPAGFYGKLICPIIGLSVYSRNYLTEVYQNGEIKQRPLSEAEKNFHFMGYGR